MNYLNTLITLEVYRELTMLAVFYNQLYGALHDSTER
jgi:hypothetical protein